MTHKGHKTTTGQLDKQQDKQGESTRQARLATHNKQYNKTSVSTSSNKESSENNAQKQQLINNQLQLDKQGKWHDWHDNDNEARNKGQ